MAITKIDNDTVAIVNTVENKRIFGKKDLADRKTKLTAQLAEIEELLAVFG